MDHKRARESYADDGSMCSPGGDEVNTAPATSHTGSERFAISGRTDGRPRPVGSRHIRGQDRRTSVPTSAGVGVHTH